MSEEEYQCENNENGLTEHQIVEKQESEDSNEKSSDLKQSIIKEEIKGQMKEEINVMRFKPPVHEQRFGAVCQYLEDPIWEKKLTKVVDFGCGEAKFFRIFKHIKGITSVLEVDIDDVVLERAKMFTEPITYDHVMPRKSPLEVQLLQGSICDPDYRLIGCDAVICIELIEHLYPGTLERLTHNIFGFIEPWIAIFTTPNADFNIFFPSLKHGEFRHYDHKFEWTREQFKDWATNITQRYPNYTVEFQDIGYGPEETRSAGGCSQLATFVHKQYEKKTEILEDNENIIDLIKDYEKLDHEWDNINWDDRGKFCKIYKTINKSEYPFWIDTRPYEERLVQGAICRINIFVRYDGIFYDEEKNLFKIPLELLYDPNMKEEGPIDIQLLGKLLMEKDMKVEDDSLIYEEKSDSISDEDIPEIFQQSLEFEHVPHDEEVTEYENPWHMYSSSPFANEKDF